MSDSEFGKAVFIAVTVILAKPSFAQSPATSQAAMTFAVEKKAVRVSATANGLPIRFLVDTGATMVAFATGGRWRTWRGLKVVVSYIDGINRRWNHLSIYVFLAEAA